MILQIKNKQTYEQSITLHTGEAKTIDPGMAIRVNTGMDYRLISYYASLVNYEFDVTAIQASGHELNYLNDAIDKMNVIKSTTETNKVLTTKEVFPKDNSIESETPVEPREVYNPKVLDGNKSSNYDPMLGRSTSISDTTILDSKLGVEVNETPEIEVVDEVVESVDVNENAVNSEVVNTEEPNIEVTTEVQDSKDDINAKWYKLDELDDATLKLILSEVFNESEIKLRSKSKIIYHIIDLANESHIDVYELVDKYLSK